jgi:hypothetical protein
VEETSTTAIDALKEIRVVIDKTNRDYDSMYEIDQMRHGEEIWLQCVERIQRITHATLESY